MQMLLLDVHKNEVKMVEANGKLSRVLATFAADNIDDAIREIRHLIS